jgi:hypothetical protein
MKAAEQFKGQPKYFWANVRTLSAQLGYTERGTQRIKQPTLDEIHQALQALSLTSTHVQDSEGRPTEFGDKLLDYFKYRAEVLNSYVQSRLMNAAQARQLFQELQDHLNPTCPLPMNKQKGEMRAPAYFTGIINMLIEANAAGYPCDYDPRTLTTVTQNDAPLRTLARRVDGAFSSAINPIAIWEIKEYYYTTTFGSRIADGVYESLLDGMELEELREHEGIEVKHYFMIDAYDTWWRMGRSYLCRIVDMLHMGYVDEVLFGREVVERLPDLVREWVAIASSRN